MYTLAPELKWKPTHANMCAVIALLAAAKILGANRDVVRGLKHNIMIMLFNGVRLAVFKF